MENLEVSFFRKAFVFRSKALVVRFFLLLALVMLALSLPMEGILMRTKLHALVNWLLEGPAFGFLLLNCLIVTIIASSKLEGEKRGHKGKNKELESIMGQFKEKGCEKGDLVVENVPGELESHTPTQKGYDYPGSIRKNEESFYQNTNNNCCSEKSGLHEEESDRELATSGVIEKLGDEKGDDIVVENVTEDGGSHYNDTPLKNAYDVHSKNKGGSYPRRSRSLNGKPYDYKPKDEQLKKNDVSEKKPIRSRDRVASRRNEKVRLHPNKPLMTSDLEKTQLIITRDCLVSREAGSHPDQKNALQNSFDTTADEKCVKGRGRAGNFVGNPAPAPTATAHPSMEEVWAAIRMQSDKCDNCTASNKQAEKRTNEEPNSPNVKKPQLAAATATPTQPLAAAAALAPPAADLGTPPPKAAAAAATSRRAAKAAPPKYPAAEKAPVAAAAEEGRELEELNRRAEKFIARFNGQIRLQREESLQRQKRGRRTCNYERSYALQLPAPGLLVG